MARRSTRLCVQNGEKDTKTWTNIAEPFLATRAGRDDRHTRVLLVNPTGYDLTDVRIETGGHYSDDAGVAQATGTPKTFERVAAGGWVEVEEPDDDELEEFVVWWTVSFAGTPAATLHFALFKGRDGVGIADVPVVGGGGALIPRSGE